MSASQDHILNDLSSSYRPFNSDDVSRAAADSFRLQVSSTSAIELTIISHPGLLSLGHNRFTGD